MKEIIPHQMVLAGQELRKVLGRAPGTPFTTIQLARAKRVHEMMMTGKLKTGDIWAICGGLRDDELGFQPEYMHAAQPKGQCRDCQVDITQPGATFPSDPARCRPCRKLKKQQYNTATRGRV